MTRRGFALVELLVAALISSLLAMLVGKLTLDAASTLRDRSERMGSEQAFRVTAGAARTLLEPLGIDSSSGADILPAGAASLVARAVRAAGVVCDAAENRLLVRAGADWWGGLRVPAGGRDSLILATVLGGDRWVVAPLIGSPSGALCPDGSAAYSLPTVLEGADLAQVGAGSPLQVFEPVELRIYLSSGARWVGLRQTATGESIQPLAGPFTAGASGLTYFDRQGSAGAAGLDVAMVTLGIGGVTERSGGVGLARLGAARADSVELTVTLRGRQ